MSNFTPGVRELHAINAQGHNQYFATSGELQTVEQLNEWFATETAKHGLPHGYSWYPLDSTDSRFGKQLPVEKAPIETPPTAPVAGQGTGAPGQGESQAGTGPPMKEPGHNANTLDGTDVVLAHDSNAAKPKPKMSSKPVNVVTDDDKVRERQKKISLERSKKSIELNAALQKHMSAFKLP